MIDSHSHIGTDSFHSIEGSLSEYINESSKLGINCANLMPVPCPRYSIDNGEIVQPLVWSFDNSRIILNRKIIDSNGEFRLILNPQNPYAEYNSIIQDRVNKIDGFKINFIPLIHPNLDTIEYLEQVLSTNPKAIKIHGIAAGIGPSEIKKDFFRLVSRHNIPLIVHTDCFLGDQPKSGLEHLYLANEPINWINILEREGIRAFLAHGARLCSESIERVKNSDNLILGLAPDLLLSSERDRLHKSDNYLVDLVNLAGVEKVALDLDYPWNIYSREIKNLEWEIVDRLKGLLSESELEKVGRENASVFFKI